MGLLSSGSGASIWLASGVEAISLAFDVNNDRAIAPATTSGINSDAANRYVTAIVVSVSSGVAGLALNAPAGTSSDSSPGKRFPIASASSKARSVGVPLDA